MEISPCIKESSLLFYMEWGFVTAGLLMKLCSLISDLSLMLVGSFSVCTLMTLTRISIVQVNIFLAWLLEKGFGKSQGTPIWPMLYGSLYFHEQNFSNIFRLFHCGGHYLFINSAQMVVYPLRYKRSLSLRKEVMFKSTREKKILECIDTIRSTEGAKDCSVKDYLNVLTPISLPLSLEILLSLRADKNKTVVLAVVGYSYKDMLMSWVCRLNHLQILNYLVCALDDDIYDFSILQGLPVYKYANLETKISFDNSHFGTECFQKVTKVKSRMLLQILKLGYNVLMSDVDIYWFKNPLPFLSSFGPAVLVAQSDEYSWQDL